MLSSLSLAFLYEIKVLNKEEIRKLKDDALVDAYIDCLVELEASKSFHQTAGFTPKEYSKHKELLKYKIFLKTEIQKRKLELPSLGEGASQSSFSPPQEPNKNEPIKE